jgi:uncharacterized protein
MKNILRWLPPTWTIIWKTTLFFIIWGFLLAPLIVPFAEEFKTFRQEDSFYMLRFEAAGALTIFAAAWFMTRFIDKRPFVSLGLAPRHLIRDLLFGMGLGALWLAASMGLLWMAGWAEFHGFETFSLITSGSIALNAFTQEVLARSYIFQTIRSQTNPVCAIILSSILFSAFHAGAFKEAWLLPAVNVFIAGILFGAAYQLSGNLWLPTGIHFAWNFLLDPVLGLTISGKDLSKTQSPVFSLNGPAIFTGGTFGIEGGLVVTLASVLFIGAIFLLFRRRHL